MDEEQSHLDHACRELGILGREKVFDSLLQQAQRQANLDINTVLWGQPGVGKFTIARLIHHLAVANEQRPCVIIDCEGDEDVIKKELFGGEFERGSSSLLSLSKLADGTPKTLILRRIDALPMSLQVVLARALQQGRLDRGEDLDPFTLISTFSGSLDDAVERRDLAPELLLKLGIPLKVPSLSSRRAAIPELSRHLLGLWNKSKGKSLRFDYQAVLKLKECQWRLNLEELKEKVEQSAIVCHSEDGIIRSKDLLLEEVSPCFEEEIKVGFDLNSHLEALRTSYVRRALSQANGNKAAAGRLLNWSPQQMQQYLKRREGVALAS